MGQRGARDGAYYQRNPSLLASSELATEEERVVKPVRPHVFGPKQKHGALHPRVSQVRLRRFSMRRNPVAVAAHKRLKRVDFLLSQRCPA
eukprot:UN2433